MESRNNTSSMLIDDVDITNNAVGKVVVASGTKTVRVEGTANQGTSCVIKASVPTNGTGTNVTTKIYAIKLV